MAQRPSVPDYYMVLGTKPDASRDEICQSYKKLAKSWRKSGMSGIGVHAMAAIDEAYDTLKNEERRNIYDVEYPSIRRAWKQYQRRKTIAAQADYDDSMSNFSSDADDEDEDGEEDDESDNDDGGPDGEAIDDTYTEQEEESDDEDTIAVAVVRREVTTIVKRRVTLVIDSEDEKEESEEEADAEFTDGDEPESDDDDVDERVDRYAHYCTGYAEDSDTDEDAGYAIRLRSGRWVEMDQHYLDDPDHHTCDLEDY